MLFIGSQIYTLDSGILSYYFPNLRGRIHDFIIHMISNDN
ncbi:MAG: Uncharacterised protein [Flavobacteriaceae bacterium]|jgi:hypothetical protein|nr:MAG: Uncharacterised protein [Flavobacteriaceae bacterium]